MAFECWNTLNDRSTAIAAHMLGLTCVADAIFAGCWTGMLTLRLHEESAGPFRLQVKPAYRKKRATPT